MRSKLTTSHRQIPSQTKYRHPRYTQNSKQSPKSPAHRQQNHSRLKLLIDKYKKIYERSDKTIKNIMTNSFSQQNSTEKSQKLFLKVLENQQFTFEKNKALDQNDLPNSHYNFSRTFKNIKIQHTRNISSSSLSIFSNKVIQQKMGKNPILKSKNFMVKERFGKARYICDTKNKETRIMQCSGHKKKYIINKSHHNCVNWEKD